MDNLNFSSSIKLKVNDGREGVMLDYPLVPENGEEEVPYCHYYCLTCKLDDNGNFLMDSNNKPIMCILKTDYQLNTNRNYESFENKEIPYNEDNFLRKKSTKKEPNPEPWDVVSFNVKNFPGGPEQLEQAYGFINVKSAKDPVFMYGKKLDNSLLIFNIKEANDET